MFICICFRHTYTCMIHMHIYIYIYIWRIFHFAVTRVTINFPRSRKPHGVWLRLSQTIHHPTAVPHFYKRQAQNRKLGTLSSQLRSWICTYHPSFGFPTRTCIRKRTNILDSSSGGRENCTKIGMDCSFIRRYLSKKVKWKKKLLNKDYYNANGRTYSLCKRKTKAIFRTFSGRFRRDRLSTGSIVDGRNELLSSF